MVSRIKEAAITLVLSLVTVLLAASCVLAQTTSTYSAPRAWDGHPDINGIWQAIGTAHWDIQDHPARAGLPELGALGAVPPGQGIVVGDEIPYQPWALEKRQSNSDNRQSEDPQAKCYLPGVPRATYLPYPFQILQGTNKIMIVYGYAEANRTIHMDKDNPETAPLDTWMGRSHGHWDGDTLVVDVHGFNGQSWFDRAGNFASDSLKVVERYTPIGPNAMMYEATLEDSTVFTRPWKISLPLYRRLEENVQVLEYKCVEFSEEMLYGHLRKNKRG